MIRSSALHAFLATVLVGAAASVAQAQGNFPARQITLVVPLPAGGTADLLCRLAVGSRERLKDYPRVATIAETLPGVYADTWMAVAAPLGMPKEITKRISDAIGQAFKMPDLRARILSLEADPLGSTPEQMREMIRRSEQLWGPVVTAAKISVE